MKTNIKMACLSLFLATGMAHASSQCDGFEIRIKNNFEHLNVKNVELVGAEITPRFAELSKGQEAVFVVSNSSKKMNGEFKMITPLKKEIVIRYDLRNALGHCDHDDKSGQSSGGIRIESERGVNKVTYTIG